jgi:hypothetical protein
LPNVAKAFAAELAFAHYLNIPNQTGINKWSNGQAICDIAHGGKQIDVKTNTANYPSMLIEEKNLKVNWHYVLVTGSMESKTFAMVGYILGSQIAATGQLIDNKLGQGPSYRVTKSLLTEFKKP